MLLFLRAWSLSELLIGVVILATCCAIVWIVLKQLKIDIPQWVIQISWAVLVCVVAVFAIRLVMSL